MEEKRGNGDGERQTVGKARGRDARMQSLYFRRVFPLYLPTAAVIVGALRRYLVVGRCNC